MTKAKPAFDPNIPDEARHLDPALYEGIRDGSILSFSSLTPTGPAVDPFSGFATGLDSPYTSSFTIVKDDSEELGAVTRAIYVGGAGDIALTMLDYTTCLLKAVPVGTTLRVRARLVKSTGTTATLMVGLV